MTHTIRTLDRRVADAILAKHTARGMVARDLGKDAQGRHVVVTHDQRLARDPVGKSVSG
jgi:hypothetical protein